jgi:hypothetical protein
VGEVGVGLRQYRLSNILLYVLVCASFSVSFRWLYWNMQYFSNVYRHFNLSAVFSISSVSSIVPNAWLILSKLWTYFELPCLYCIAIMCSLNLVWNVQPVWPVYFLHVLHCNLYTPGLLYLYLFVVNVNGV